MFLHIRVLPNVSWAVTTVMTNEYVSKGSLALLQSQRVLGLAHDFLGFCGAFNSGQKLPQLAVNNPDMHAAFDWVLRP